MGREEQDRESARATEVSKRYRCIYVRQKRVSDIYVLNDTDTQKSRRVRQQRASNQDVDMCDGSERTI